MDRPKITIGNIRASNNTNDGIRAEGVDLEIGNADVSNNGGKGINILENPEQIKNNINNRPTCHPKERAWNIAYVVIGGILLAALSWLIKHLCS